MGAKKSRFCDSRALVRLCRKQGFECVETSKGFRVLAKDGERQVTLHMTVSSRGMQNAKAELKKIGVEV